MHPAMVALNRLVKGLSSIPLVKLITLPQLCLNYMTLRIGNIDRLIAFFPFQLAPDGGQCFCEFVAHRREPAREPCCSKGVL